MQRYSATSCAAGGVNNSAINGTSTRDPTRVESSFASSNFPSWIQTGHHQSLGFCLLELLMGSDSNTKATIKLVKLDKALKLAETWVCNMSESITDETNAYEYQARPSRLGLGAKIIPSVNVASNSHAERILLGKLNAQKRRTLKDVEKPNVTERTDEDEDEDERESRTSSFSKKRTMPPATSLPSTKRIK